MTANRRLRLKSTGAAIAAGAILGSAALLGASQPGVMVLDHASASDTAASVARAGSPALDEMSEAFASIAARVKPSVVYITAERAARTVGGRRPMMPELPPEFRRFFEMPGMPPMGEPRQQRPRNAESSGSGFIVSRDGYILTNAHVVDGAEEVTVRLLDRREFSGKVIGVDASTDVAVLKIDAEGLTPAPFGSSEAVRVGEWVLAVGNPLGENLTFTVTSGIVSAKGRALNLPGASDRSIQDFIQTDAAINPGNSGGPLVNMHGEVIGINTAIASPTGSYAGYGFAVPIDLARKVMDQLVANGEVQRVALGITVRNATANDAAYADVPQIGGVVVQDFSSADSPAKAAGIRAGDIIVAVDGKPVDYVGQLQERIAFRKPGETVALEVARKGGARATVRVKLEAMEDGERSRRDTARDDRSGSERGRGADVEPLGVTVAPIDDATARQLEIPASARGLLVTDVAEDGPSSEQLVAPGSGGPDVILSVEGKAVRSAAELRGAVAELESGEIVTLRVYNAPAKTYRIERVRVG